jgi:hypothetical protein
MDQIEAETLDDFGMVDLEKARKHKLYSVFEEAVCELRGIDLSKMDDTTKIVSTITIVWFEGECQRNPGSH